MVIRLWIATSALPPRDDAEWAAAAYNGTNNITKKHTKKSRLVFDKHVKYNGDLIYTNK